MTEPEFNQEMGKMTDTPSDAGLDLGHGRTSPTSADRDASNWGDPELDGDRLREECGVFGIFGHPDAAAITALGLHALQHRGQEAAGIVSFDGKRFHSERRMGLVGDNFSRREVIDRLPGMSAIGHVRYSTTGETILRNVQPLFAELDGGGFAIGHNGNLTNGLTLAPPAGARRRHHAVDHRHRGDPASGRAAPSATASSTVSSRGCASSKAPMRSSA